MSTMQGSLAHTAGRYRHEAFLYSGMAEFVAGTVPLIRRALEAGDPILVVVSQSKIDVLRRELGPDAGNVSFADMAAVGGNPARIISEWRGFLQSHPGASQVWGVGEPVYPGRSSAEIAECQLHEALLNVAFDATVPFWLLCPYDVAALTADMIEEAYRTHPFIAQGEDRQASGSFRPVDQGDPFARPLPARPAGTASMSFESGGLRRVRAFVAGHAQRAGTDQRSADALVAAVNELATNSLRHGGGSGEVRTWVDARSLVFEVSDHGHISAPLAGRLPPTSGGGAGLWLANHLCDLVQIYSSPDGTAIRVRRSI
jgi:anti-sigma regulatory factor (Ser/Thr protein kinase)